MEVGLQICSAMLSRDVPGMLGRAQRGPLLLYLHLLHALNLLNSKSVWNVTPASSFRRWSQALLRRSQAVME